MIKRIKYKGEIIELRGITYWWNGRPFDSLNMIKGLINLLNAKH